MSADGWSEEYMQQVANFYGITLEEARAKRAKMLTQHDDPEKPMCVGCARWPEEISEYIEEAKLEHITPTQFVIENEGTLNARNGHFLCTGCYIKNGSPTSSRGWVCP